MATVFAFASSNIWVPLGEFFPLDYWKVDR